jgi:hypothetical protein
MRFTITGTASDALSGVSSVEYSFDGASWAGLALSGNAFSQSVASPTVGTVSTLAVRATDRAGNVAAVSIPLNLDLVPPVLTMTVPNADDECNGDGLCTGAAVVNVASSSDGTSFDFSGTVDDASAALTIKIGSQPEVKVTRDAARNWHYTWAPVAGSGEVVVVVTATNALGNTASSARRVWVDVTAPACNFAPKDGDRLVERAGPLLSCTEAMALSSVRGALSLTAANGNVGLPEDFYADANNVFFYSRSGSKVLDGNTTLALAFGTGAVDKAGNPAVALGSIRFRTRPVLPAAETVVGKSLSGLDYPRMAVDVDGLPFVFVWDASGQGGSRARLFAWDGRGDGAGANPGQWIEVNMTTPPSSSFGPVRDFRIGQGGQSNSDLSLIHTGRIVMSPEPGTNQDPVTTSYGASADDFKSFQVTILPQAIDAKSQPSFYGGQSASIAATASAGGWVIAETATDERIVLANASSLQVQLWMRNPDKSVWEQDPGFSGIGVQVASMHQAGFIGLPCSSTTTCVSDLHVWHVSGGDIGAKPSPLGKVTAAGVGPLPHPATGSTMFAPIYVGWSEHPAGSNVPKLVVTVACQDTLPTPGTWLRSAPLVSLSSAATEVAGLDFGQGVSKVAIAVDSVSSVAGQDVHSSQFGLLPGDACGNSIAVDWSSGGGLVQGRNPTTAFSNDGVLWRALAREKDLWVLAPLNTR